MPLVATRGGASAFGLGWSAAGAGEELGGMVLLTPTSISYSGTSASIGTNGSVEFSACTSLSLNGVFSANYDNYMIAMRNTGSIIRNISVRLRASGLDASGSDYTRQLLDVNGSAVTAARVSSLSTAAVFNTNPGSNGGICQIYGPYLAQSTAVRDTNINSYLGAYIVENTCTHALSTSYDGITMFMDTGNFTGLVSVYGLVGA